MAFLPSLLPKLLAAAMLAALVIGLCFARRATGETTGFPWLLLLLAPLPELLAAADLGFAGMLTIYVAWPASMGPLAVAYHFLRGRMLWSQTLFLLTSLGLSSVWLGLLHLLWRRNKKLATGLWVFGLLLAGWLLYVRLLPPD